MTPSGFFERIRSAVCEKAVAFWREDTSPKKRRTDSGEEALLSAEISATRSKVVFCLFLSVWLRCSAKRSGCSAASRRPFCKSRAKRATPARFRCLRSAVKFSIAMAWSLLRPFRRAVCGPNPRSFKTHGSAVRSAGGSLGRVRSRDSRAH